jgi:hypothetical protein
MPLRVLIKEWPEDRLRREVKLLLGAQPSIPTPEIDRAIDSALARGYGTPQGIASAVRDSLGIK